MPALSAAHAALGAAIRHRRSAAGLSQGAVADAAGCTANYVSLIELGEGNVSFGKLLALAAALGVRASVLVASAETETVGP